MTDRELMQQALDALDVCHPGFGQADKLLQASVAIRARLAEPQEEPVDGALLEDMVEGTHPAYGRGLFTTDNCIRKLYTHPAPLRALSEPEIDAVADSLDDDGWIKEQLTNLEIQDFARAVLKAAGAPSGIKEPS